MPKQQFEDYLLNRSRERDAENVFASQEAVCAKAMLKGGPDAPGLTAEGARTKLQEFLPHRKG